jgi:ribonuclease H2 subunit A
MGKKEEATFVPASHIPPSISEHDLALLSGESYSHYSDIPTLITVNTTTDTPVAGTPCVLGVDEAGRGPVIGPMMYGVFYLPIEIQQSLLADKHHFDDSKVLTPAVRAGLFKAVCSPGSDLYESCGWAVKSLSARDISAGMMRNGGSYNLNAQAMDATIELIRGVVEKGVNVREIYVDTIGHPGVYQKKLERIFPTIKITVEKKADSLYPCVSAASVAAKVSRDVSCERLYQHYATVMQMDGSGEPAWGSGYPSDARCVAWLKSDIDPVFGWGNECRFSWGTAKDLLEVKRPGVATRADWPNPTDEENMQLSQFFSANGGPRTETEELQTWFGSSVGQEAF